MFSLEMSKEQKMIKNEFAKIVKDLVTENAGEMEDKQEIPLDSVQKAWELGASVSMGTEEQRNKYLPLFCAESYPACTLAINEPHFNFDVMDLQTTAKKKNGAYVLSGAKCFVTKARIGMSAIGTGISRASFEFAMNYAKERVQFGEPIVHKQSVAFMIAEMAYEVDAMRLMTWQAASLADAGIRNSLQASMCKAKAGKAATIITQKCCELLGPLGFSQKHLLEKWMRDVKITDIFEGTGQIQHLIVARQLMKLSSKELK